MRLLVRPHEADDAELANAPEADGEGLTAEFRTVVATRRPSRWRWALLVAGLWTVYAVISAKHTVLVLAMSEGEEHARPMVDFLPWAFSTMWFWAALTPGIVWLARRFRIDRPRWGRRVVYHLAFAFAIAFIDAAWDMWVRPYVIEYPRRPLLVAFLNQVDSNLFQYFVIVAVTHSLDYYRLYRERRLQAAELGAELARAQLEVLKMQLQPHFLFNTLNSIAELVHEDAHAADRMVTRLGDFLRLSLDHAGRQEVPLRQEIQFLHAYLDIERIRFGDRLRVRQDVAGETLDALVPNLVLQPLVENAIRHGIAAHARSGMIEITARRRGDRLELEVGDNGGGLLAPADGLQEGVGLGNTRSRLQRLYGEAHSLMLRNRTMGGVIVTLTMPFRTTADDAAALPLPGTRRAAS
jgi:hypothetical protein